MASDSWYLGGADVEDVRRAMDEKMAEIRGKGGEVLNPSFEIERGGDVPNAQARFDYRLPVDEIGREVEFDPDDVEDPPA
jgi:hypothetical protein